MSIRIAIASTRKPRSRSIPRRGATPRPGPSGPRLRTITITAGSASRLNLSASGAISRWRRKAALASTFARNSTTCLTAFSSPRRPLVASSRRTPTRVRAIPTVCSPAATATSTRPIPGCPASVHNLVRDRSWPASRSSAGQLVIPGLADSSARPFFFRRVKTSSSVPKRSLKSRREPAPPIAPVEEPLPVESPQAARGSLPWLLLLLAGSGCAALIYEIVWFQLLQLVIGASAVSLGLLLAAYMGGLCLGSAGLARFVPARNRPLRVYAYLELGIGALGIAALFGVPLVSRLYVAGATIGLLGLVLRGLVAALCLLPPTVLMGGSLPAITRCVQTTPKGVTSMGLLYSANIAGAVFGCLLAGFYLLRVHDMAIATYAAAAVNF